MSTTLAQFRRTRLEQLRQATQQQQPRPRFRLASFLSWDALGVIVPIIIGLIGWYLLRKKKSRLKDYFDRIDTIYGQFKLKDERCETALYDLQEMIDHDLKEGKLEETAHHVLSARINKYLKEVKKGEVRG